MSQKRSHTCTNCGKVFERFISLSPNTKNYFCSRACHKAHGQATVQCPICNKLFQVKKSRVGRDQTLCCSQECKRTMHARTMLGKQIKARVPITCKQCGKVRYVFPCFAARLFCGKRCHAAWMSEHQGGENSPVWKGGTHDQYYGPNWRAQRKAARQRDNHRCRACGAKPKGKAFDVHHIKPFRTFGYICGQNDAYLQANDLTNLITLCPSCHAKAEHGYVPIQPYLL